MRYRDKFRSDFETLFNSYVAHTGARKTDLSECVAGYPTFYNHAPRSDISGGKFDSIVARFSAIWPADLAWPDGIERPEPSKDADIVVPQARARPAISPLSDWPEDKPWPADIPRPVGSPEQNVSGEGS